VQSGSQRLVSRSRLLRSIGARRSTRHTGHMLKLWRTFLLVIRNRKGVKWSTGSGTMVVVMCSSVVSIYGDNIMFCG
jgi:hypothetical protein